MTTNKDIQTLGQIMAESIPQAQQKTATQLSQGPDSDSSQRLYGDDIAKRIKSLEEKWNPGKMYPCNNIEYQAQKQVFIEIGNALLKHQGRAFIIDDDNKDAIGYLIMHANRWGIGTKYYEGYDPMKNLLIIGKPGSGKTLLMQILSEFTKITNLPTSFQNTSMTEIMNYYKIHSHIDYFTYNTEGNKVYQSKPFGICINDLGIETEEQKSYGTTLTTVTDELLFARYEIYQQRSLPYHITTNLTIDDFKKRFGRRLIDRFNSFNILHLRGGSRR